MNMLKVLEILKNNQTGMKVITGSPKTTPGGSGCSVYTT